MRRRLGLGILGALLGLGLPFLCKYSLTLRLRFTPESRLLRYLCLLLGGESSLCLSLAHAAVLGILALTISSLGAKTLQLGGFLFGFHLGYVSDAEHSLRLSFRHARIYEKFM